MVSGLWKTSCDVGGCPGLQTEIVSSKLELKHQAKCLPSAIIPRLGRPWQEGCLDSLGYILRPCLLRQSRRGGGEDRQTAPYKTNSTELF